jgi:uncharacterized protein (DUF2147 family)
VKGVFAFAIILLASSAAQAQYTFDYGGRTIRIDPDRGSVSIPGVYDNTESRNKRSRNDRDVDRPRKQPPRQTKTGPQAPVTGVVKIEPVPAPVSPSPEPSTATVKLAPVDTPTSVQPPASAPAPQVQQEAAPAPVVAAAPAQPTPPAISTAPSAPSPLGLWLTEEKEGKVRIEPCGPNLCGYSVDARSNQNGEEVLINMKPGKDSKWQGRIHDPNTGSNYDSTISLKGASFLRVQGCAFGGMFCGGQTWSRLN